MSQALGRGCPGAGALEPLLGAGQEPDFPWLLRLEVELTLIFSHSVLLSVARYPEEGL